ncbi:MAG: type II secretion system protein [Verrucomicrobiaceae bacterium]|nr:MAG: type II secretion system protein [Verrucomicrobiaceae bacterium]
MKVRRPGFTLVEILVTIVIIAVLGSVGMAGFTRAREKSKGVVELGAARNLIAGYLIHASDHNGQLLAGYKIDPEATNLDGKLLHNPLNARYPFRLAPSLPQIRGTMFYNGNEALLDKQDGEYNSSLRPNMGINGNLVGGFFGGDSLLDPSSPRLVKAYGNFYVSNLSGADDPAKLIVFASARKSNTETGYFQVRPPQMTGKVWSSGKYSKDGQATDHGYVDFRWDGKAVVAMLAGNVEMLDEDQLRDMRRWSNQASMANDPNYLIKPQ